MAYDDDIVAESLPNTPGMEIASVQVPAPLVTLDVEQQVLAMEKAVRFMPRMIKARNQVIRMCTFAEDWTRFGEGDKAKACLCAAGAMRIMDKGNFPIRFYEVKSRKEPISDADGGPTGYRYVFEGYASLDTRTVYALGQFSTRDALFGKKSGSFRDIKEINESYIRQAAHTYFKGNAIKDLLGLKGIPWKEFEALTRDAGQDPAAASKVSHATGKQGGTTGTDRDKQNELQAILVGLAETNKVIKAQEMDGKIAQVIEPVGNELADFACRQKDPMLTVAQASLRSLTTFSGKDGIVQGTTDFARPKGKQLEITLRVAKELIAKEPAD